MTLKDDWLEIFWYSDYWWVWHYANSSKDMVNSSDIDF